MSMSKRDYETIARAIAAGPNPREVGANIGAAIAQSNPRFDIDRFLKLAAPQAEQVFRPAQRATPAPCADGITRLLPKGNLVQFHAWNDLDSLGF